MESKPVAIDLGSLILVASMVVFLALAIVGETIALVFEGRPHRLLAAHPGTAIIPAWGISELNIPPGRHCIEMETASLGLLLTPALEAKWSAQF